MSTDDKIAEIARKAFNDFCDVQEESGGLTTEDALKLPAAILRLFYEQEKDEFTLEQLCSVACQIAKQMSLTDYKEAA